MSKIDWPEGKDFAFTIFDDTDYATLESVRPVYDRLAACGLRITKSVWPLEGSGRPICGGSTCEDKDYLDWLLQLQQQGFEIGYHLATYHTSRRFETKRGLDRFEELFGAPPVVMANHSGCRENLYWGSDRVTSGRRLAYNVLTGFRHHRKFRGHVESDPHFWGDLCRDRITYVRNFVFRRINTLAVCPFMPYHDPRRPYVNYWFASSDGAEVNAFARCISEENQDTLEAEGGACIVYTHFGIGFCRNGMVDGRFERLVSRLSAKNGWFVPVTTLLDYLRERNGGHVITDRERKKLERAWLRDRLTAGSS